MAEIAIRTTVPADLPALAALYPAAFPAEALWPLVSALLEDAVAPLSLAAFQGGRLAGHAVFTPCGIEGCRDQVSLLGPLAVTPASQRQGIGRALVQAGLPRLATAGIGHVCVLGDPAYYSRLGFGAEHAILPPYPLPAEWDGAWQGRATAVSATLPCQGRLIVPPPWRQATLWAP